jgi:hypothetical protein
LSWEKDLPGLGLAIGPALKIWRRLEIMDREWNMT